MFLFKLCNIFHATIKSLLNEIGYRIYIINSIFLVLALLKITNWTPEYFIENRSKCNSILENLEALKEIPLLNINTLQTIKHRQLVKFKGMIQDMHDPECYLRQYEVKNTQTKTCELKCGMYTDSAECLVIIFIKILLYKALLYFTA